MNYKFRWVFKISFLAVQACTGLLKLIVGVLTTCHTQCTWDRSMCIFSFNRTTLQVFVTYLTGALYVHPLWFSKHQHDSRVRSTQNAFSLPFAAILVNCAPSGEMHNYCTPHIIKENFENFLINRCNYILLSQVYCIWQIVNTAFGTFRMTAGRPAITGIQICLSACPMT
jgi:hypothetical protein